MNSPKKGRTYPPTVPPKPHVIDDISYSQDYIVCTCGWKGVVDEFQAHRRAALAKAA